MGFRDRNNQLERTLPNLKHALHLQKLAIEDIHSFVESRDTQMKDEINILLSHVRSTCDNEIKGKTKIY